MTLVPSNDKILKTRMDNFDFNNPPVDPVGLARTLAEEMIKYSGIGLSANQIGLPYRVFVMTGTPIIACFNPIIVDKSYEMIYLDEGCLSFSGLYIKIKRPRSIRLRYTQPNGNVVTEKFDDLTARIAQHEISHLNGITFLQEANSYHLEQARKEMKNETNKNLVR